jgi:hypothetical protein
MRYVLTGIAVGVVVALLLSLHAVGHALPIPGHKRWSAMTLIAQEKAVKANLHHARTAIQFVRTHRREYARSLAAADTIIQRHRALERKAERNLRAIEAKLHPLPHTIHGIICYVWGDLCGQALAVVQCESGFDIYNRTGDYWGLFQFGSEARSEYGFAWDAWTQTRAAKALYDDRWWYPWECANSNYLGYY